jgi:hypothetical protein
MPKFEFDENNSGGSWWLNRAQYDALFAAGWKYEVDEYDKSRGWDKDPYLGGDPDVPYGWRHNLTLEAPSLQAAVENWEAATGEDFFAEGCNCCGAPFSIRSDSDGSTGGDYVDRQVIRPF